MYGATGGPNDLSLLRYFRLRVRPGPGVLKTLLMVRFLPHATSHVLQARSLQRTYTLASLSFCHPFIRGRSSVTPQERSCERIQHQPKEKARKQEGSRNGQTITYKHNKPPNPACCRCPRQLLKPTQPPNLILG